LQDAQRAMSVVRSKADDWKIDAKRIGMLGFSAGGHLTAALATNYEKRVYEPIDSIDKVSCRPDFAVLIYPGGVLEKGKDTLRSDIRVTGQTPPMFFAHASNDPVSPENSVALYLALKQPRCPRKCTSTPAAATASGCANPINLARPGPSAVRTGCAAAAS
jgi:acetyl esterase/lipase